MPARKTRPRADGQDVLLRHLHLPPSKVPPDFHSMIGCKQSSLHANSPMRHGFVAWHIKMLETHRNVACPGCGAFVVYIPRLGR